MWLTLYLDQSLDVWFVLYYKELHSDWHLNVCCSASPYYCYTNIPTAIVIEIDLYELLCFSKCKSILIKNKSTHCKKYVTHFLKGIKDKKNM